MMFCIIGAAQAATERRIIVDDDITAHPPDALSEELVVFESVGAGIEIMLAVCEEQPDCMFAISDEEIEQLVDTLDKRISQLNELREEEMAEPGYLDLLDEYRQTREQYAAYMREINDITRAIDEGTFFAEEPADLEPEPDEHLEARRPRYLHEDLSLDMFEDADEPLPFQ